MSWRVAFSLDELLGHLDARFPTRDRASDGGIGDARHATQTSDHNPWFGPAADGKMLVTARDYTHDPAAGLDMHVLTDQLQASRDPRLKYVIFDRWLMDTRPNFNPWRWVRYLGANPHTTHMHVSVMPNLALADDRRPWTLPLFGDLPLPAPAPEPPPGGPLPAVAVGTRALTLTTPFTRGTDVLALQRVLTRWYPSLPPLELDGVYGPATMARVRVLQQRAGITVDGIAGRQTFGVLHMV